MKHILLASLLIVVSFFASLSTSYAQTEEDTTTISFVAYWAKGDIYDYKITKIKKKWSEDKLVTNDSSQYIARFEVIDSTKNSYTIKWSFKNNLKAIYNIPDKALKKLSKYKNTSIIYKTDEFGAFEGIENWKELSNMMKDTFGEIVKLETNKTKRKEMEARLKPIRKAYESKEGIEQIVFKELQSFHSPLGGVFDVTEPIEYEQELPNLISGGVIKGDGKVTFLEVNREDGFCIFNQELKLNPNESKAMILEVFKKMKLPEDKFSKELEKSTLSINDIVKYEYFYYPGLPYNVIVTREVVMNMPNLNMKQTDTTKIELIIE